MKEAAGEANLTVIAIILIGVIAAVVTPIINSMMTTSAKKGCCTNYGGYWKSGACYTRSATGTDTKVADTAFWKSADKTCVD